MMGKKKRRRRSTAMTVPIAVIPGVVRMVYRPIQALLAGDLGEAQRSFMWDTIGVDETGRFDAMQFAGNMTPLVIGLLVHKFVGGAPLNLNRMLARAKVPFIRI